MDRKDLERDTDTAMELAIHELQHRGAQGAAAQLERVLATRRLRPLYSETMSAALEMALLRDPRDKGPYYRPVAEVSQ